MTPEIEVREAAPSDASWIAAAQVAMADETEGMALDPEAVRAGVRHVFDHPEVGRYLVAEAGGERLGCTLLLSEWSDWRNGEVWWIHSVWVPPEARRQGVFRAIFAAAEARARAAGARGLRLYVDRSNRTAQRVYERLGMDAEHYALYEKMLD